MYLLTFVPDLTKSYSLFLLTNLKKRWINTVTNVLGYSLLMLVNALPNVSLL